MQPRALLPASAERLAACQEGVVTRAQLLGLGVSRHTIDRCSRSWHRLGRGAYLIAASPYVAPPDRARVWAGVLLGGPGARAGRFAAAALDGLAGWSEVDVITILVPGREVSRQPGFEFVRERPGVRLPSASREPARTGIDDTVLDLCALAGPDEVVTWLTRACQRRLTTPHRLRQRLTARPTVRHHRFALEILDDVAAGATSPLERRALVTVIRAHHLPRPTLQLRTGSGDHVVDAAFVEFRVIIELDGRIGHVEEGAFRDRLRDNAHARDGWVTLRFGWSDVATDPCGVAAQIADLLRARGWNGELSHCTRCRRRQALRS